MEKLVQKLPPLKKRKLSKKWQEEGGKIKRILIEDNQEWYDWRFKIH